MSKTFYIIDGHAQIYSAYYARMAARLSAPSGEPTKATMIFTTTVLKLLRRRKPDYLVVAMDAPGPTFRHEIFPAYKANRPPMPEDLPAQIDRIDQILAALRIPVLRVPGYEADDIIATLAAAAASRDTKVYICSKDKDLEQLLSDRVAMYDPQGDTELTVAALAEAKGITPRQVPDVLALQGDSIDNIPGVPDVGPKTALQWIQEYGDLDGLIAHAGAIKGKRGENLRAALDQLRLSRRLTEVDRHVPLEINWDHFAVKPPDTPALRELFQTLGFTRLLQQLDEVAPAEGGGSGDAARAVETAALDVTPAPADRGRSSGQGLKPRYILVNTPEAFRQFLDLLKRQPVFALDTETTSVNPVAAELVGLSFAWQEGTGYYLPVKGPLGARCLDRATTLARLKPVLTDPAVKKIGQNIKYDRIVLARAGIDLAGVVFDTMVASYVLDSGRAHHSLDSLAADYLGHETIKLTALLGKGKSQLTFDMVDLATAADYAAEDAEVTWRLYRYLDSRLTGDELRRLFEQVEMPLVEVLAEMELNGVALDVPWLKKMSNQLDARLTQLVEQIHTAAGCVFNVDSPKQLGEVLFDRLGLQSVKKTKGGASKRATKSTDQEVLESLSWQHPVAALMLEYRKLAKLKNTYVDKLPSLILPATRRVHASFNQTVTATGRLSSSDPNMQNIPVRTDEGQEIRRAFIPGRKGDVILAADYSQVELRFVAHFSGDPDLIRAFEAGRDIHRFVAAQVYNIPLEEVAPAQRSRAKGVNFGIIYGQTAYGLSRALGVPVEEAQRFIDEYFARYGRVRSFVDGVVERARQHGCVRTILGRRRVLPELHSRNYSRRRLAERMAVNTVVQGSAADLIKLAMINLHRRIKEEKLRMKLLLQVHDELVFELPAGLAASYAEIIRREMTTALKLRVPVTVDIAWGPNWLECK